MGIREGIDFEVTSHRIHFPSGNLLKSHTKTLVSCAPDARRLPSDVKRRKLTGPAWPMKVCSAFRRGKS